MKVSVIIAAYNIESYIEKCLDSVINQTLKEIEIIVVNDGSTDQTGLKIEKFLERDERILLINQSNKGLIEARKSGLTIAKGEYILFVDGDDWLEINALEILYENAKKNNSDIVLYHAFIAYDDGKKEFLSTYNECKNSTLEEILLGEIRTEIWSKFIKLDYIKLTNVQFPSSISFAEDLATSCSLFILNPRVSKVGISLYNYYRRSDSITNRITSKVLEIDEAFAFIKRRLYDNGLYEDYKDLFEYLVYRHMFFVCFLRYVDVEQKYNFKLYKIYKSYNIHINSNSYIKEKIFNYPLSLKLRVNAYHHSYKLGKLYDRIRKKCNRG